MENSGQCEQHFFDGWRRSRLFYYFCGLMKRSGLLSFFLIGVLGLPKAGAQKQTASVQQVWLNYANQTRFSDRWGLWADVSVRSKEAWLEDFSQIIGRAALTYYISDNTKLSAGYAYVHHFPADAHPDVSMPEHRPWQQLQWHNNSPRLRLMQWVRLEERYRRKIAAPDRLGDGYNFNYRARYNFLLAFPLSQKGFAPGSFSAVFNNEAHLNFGKEIVYNTFDQNRLFLGAFYHVNSHDQIQAGYMNLFQQLPAGNRYRSIHTARISYFHNLDLRRRKKTP